MISPSDSLDSFVTNPELYSMTAATLRDLRSGDANLGITHLLKWVRTKSWFSALSDFPIFELLAPAPSQTERTRNAELRCNLIA
jgi:hypothetical protein